MSMSLAAVFRSSSQNIEHRNPPTSSPSRLPASVEEGDTVEQHGHHEANGGKSDCRDCSDSDTGTDSSNESDGDHEHDCNPTAAASAAALRKAKVRSRKERQSEKRKKKSDFLWKQGPTPPPLPSRPSIGLIQHGQVRIMSKALMSCPEGADGEEGGAIADKVHILLFGHVESHVLGKS